MAKRKRSKRNRSQNAPPKAPPKAPDKAPPYTLRELMRDHGQDENLPVPTVPPIRIFQDEFGNPLDIDARETLAALEGEERAELEEMLGLGNEPGDETRDIWPEPGDLAIPPGASAELAMATAGVYLLQAEAICTDGEQAAREQDRTGTLAHLGCLAVNMDDTNDLLDNLERFGNNGDQNWRAVTVQRLLERFTQLEERVETLHQEYLEMLEPLVRENPKILRNPEVLQSLEMPDMAGAQHVVRIKSAEAAMRHCREQIATASTPAEQAAYCRLFFDLYHNAAHHELELRMDTPDRTIPATLGPDAGDTMGRIREMHQEELHSFNRELPTTLGPAFENASPAIIKQAREMPVEPIGFSVGILTDPETIHRPGTGNVRFFYSHVAYWHEGRRHVHGVTDPHPVNFPRELVVRQMQAAQEVEHPDPLLNENRNLGTWEKALFATHGAHSVSPEAMRGFVRTARQFMTSKHALYEMIGAAVDFHPGLTDALAKMGGMSLPIISRKKAQHVIRAARQTGLDEFQLARIAEAMEWHDPEELGINEPEHTGLTMRSVLRAAAQAGFDEEAVEEMRTWLEMQDASGDGGSDG